MPESRFYSPFRGLSKGKTEPAHEIGQTSTAIPLSLQISIIFGCFTIENLAIGSVLCPYKKIVMLLTRDLYASFRGV